MNNPTPVNAVDVTGIAFIAILVTAAAIAVTLGLENPIIDFILVLFVGLSLV